MIKFNIINFIGGSGLEPLVDKIVLSIGYPQFLVVKDTSESCVGHKSTLWLVFILEEGFDQKTSVFNICTNSDEDIVQFFGI